MQFGGSDVANEQEIVQASKPMDDGIWLSKRRESGADHKDGNFGAKSGGNIGRNIDRTLRLAFIELDVPIDRVSALA